MSGSVSEASASISRGVPHRPIGDCGRRPVGGKPKPNNWARTVQSRKFRRRCDKVPWAELGPILNWCCAKIARTHCAPAPVNVHHVRSLYASNFASAVCRAFLPRAQCRSWDRTGWNMAQDRHARLIYPRSHWLVSEGDGFDGLGDADGATWLVDRDFDALHLGQHLHWEFGPWRAWRPLL